MQTGCEDFTLPSLMGKPNEQLTSYLMIQLHVGPRGVEAPFYRPRLASAISRPHAISMNANLIAPIVMSPICCRARSHSVIHLKISPSVDFCRYISSTHGQVCYWSLSQRCVEEGALTPSHWFLLQVYTER